MFRSAYGFGGYGGYSPRGYLGAGIGYPYFGGPAYGCWGCGYPGFGYSFGYPGFGLGYVGSPYLAAG
jgi:hypothetical protein